MLPVKFGKQLSTAETKERLEYLLDRVDLKNRAKHYPNELSGGQAQRVAIARALMAKPKILLADEPTGNLDSKTGKEISQLLFDLNKEEGTTLIIVTHDEKLFTNVSRSIFLRDGKIVKSL
jgi:putative ABC transport system ATP-binding protein